MQVTDDLALLIEAARESGQIARRFFGKAPETWDKGDDAGPVTEADLAINAMLRSELTTNRPDYGWLSEESEDDQARLKADNVFIIDPIDGTRAFIAGEKHFSHSLAVAKRGKTVAAAVYVPMLDLLFIAQDGDPAALNGDEIQTSETRDLDGATVLAAKPNLDPVHWIGPVPNFARKFRPSLAYRLCLVAQGKYDAMLTLRDCWEWDIAAGDLIVRQAGGRVTDRQDDQLMFNNPNPKTKGCLAGGLSIHAALQSRLKHRSTAFAQKN